MDVSQPKKVSDAIAHLGLIEGVDYKQNGSKLLLISYKAKLLAAEIIDIVGA